MDSYLSISLLALYETCRTHPLTVLNLIVLLLNIAAFVTYILVCYYQYKRK